jgi:hypothetical protein
VITDTVLRMLSFDDYVLDVLMLDLVGHDHSPAAFIVFLLLWRESLGRRRKHIVISHQQMSASTGLSKSAVQVGIRRLLKRKRIVQTRQTVTSTPRYEIVRHWSS